MEILFTEAGCNVTDGVLGPSLSCVSRLQAELASAFGSSAVALPTLSSLLNMPASIGTAALHAISPAHIGSHTVTPTHAHLHK